MLASCNHTGLSDEACIVTARSAQEADGRLVQEARQPRRAAGQGGEAGLPGASRLAAGCPAAWTASGFGLPARPPCYSCC